MCETIIERFFILKSKELRRPKFLMGQGKILSTTTKFNRTLRTWSVYHWKSNRKVFCFFLKSFYPLLFRVKGAFFLLFSTYLTVSYLCWIGILLFTSWKYVLVLLQKLSCPNIRQKGHYCHFQKPVKQTHTQKPQTKQTKNLSFVSTYLEHPCLLPQLKPQLLDWSLTQSQRQIILSWKLRTGGAA